MLNEGQTSELPWGTNEKLDDNDLLWGIAHKYTLEQFSKLTFDEMLAEFNITGTSSSVLFDIMLKSGEENYLHNASESEQFFFEALRKKLKDRAQEIKENGFEGKIVTSYPPMIKFQGKSFPNLADFIEQQGDKEGNRLWAQNLGYGLLIELWDLISKSDRGDNQEKKFIRSMFDILEAGDRQFGYAGRRGSIINNALNTCTSDYGELSFTGRISVAFFSMLRTLCPDVGDEDCFWPYLIDAKSLRLSMR